MKALASALMLMLCMPKATENPNFPQSLSHKCKHQAKINLMLGHSQVQRPVIDVKNALAWNIGMPWNMARCSEAVQDL